MAGEVQEFGGVFSVQGKRRARDRSSQTGRINVAVLQGLRGANLGCGPDVSTVCRSCVNFVFSREKHARFGGEKRPRRLCGYPEGSAQGSRANLKPKPELPAGVCWAMPVNRLHRTTG